MKWLQVSKLRRAFGPFEKQAAFLAALLYGDAICAEIRRRDGEKCQYCENEYGPFHLDHMTPWSRGGETSVTNLTVACAPYNLSKAARSVEAWLK